MLDSAWYLSVDQGIQGPYSTPEMLEMIASGRLGAKTKVRSLTVRNWCSVDQIEPFLEHFATPADKRRSCRVEVIGSLSGRSTAPASRLHALFDAGSNHEIGGKVRDLSRHGCLVESDQALRPGDKIQVTLRVAGLGGPLRATAMVVRCSGGDKESDLAGQGHGYGLRFVDLAQGTEQRIMDFVNSCTSSLMTELPTNV